MKNLFFKAFTLLVFSFLFLESFNSLAQEDELKQLTIGLHIQQVQTDIGFGFQLLSPKFWGNFRINTSYNLNFFTYTNENGESISTPYANLYFGTRYQLAITKNIDTYFEAGTQMLINPSSISSESINVGGYGLVGVEYFIPASANRNFSFFLEIGAAGNNSKADKVPTEPKIATGFTSSIGFHYNINLKKSIK
jgi:hypothetical protein